MLTIAYHASHEQFQPSKLLAYVKAAEAAGFNAITASDHFHPWSEEQGQSGFVWSWLGAAMQTTTLPYSVVNCPCQRYHPAIIAQATATLLEMFPYRFHIAVGDGEALNERITGEKWPEKEQRRARLLEAVTVIRRLWQGETVTEHGLINIEHATLYTRPNPIPPIIAAAITPITAKWAGKWADGLITISQPIKKLKQVIENFKEGGGEHKPLHLKVQLSYSSTRDEAINTAWQQWRNCVLSSEVLADLRTPHQIKAAGGFVKKTDLEDFILISHEVKQFQDWIEQYKELGFTSISLHNVNLQQEKFIEDFGHYILPALYS